MSEIEDRLISIVIDDEYTTFKANKKDEIDDFESFVGLLDSERNDKDYDWMSDISLPEFPAHMLTQSAIDVSQYYQTRDFVDAYLEDGSEEAKLNAAAAKELINRTLNQRHLHHYPKYVRAKIINHLQGHVYLECWWEQESELRVTGRETYLKSATYDEEGDLQFQMGERDVVEEVLAVDRFNYDVIDSRNIFTDNTYTYTLQDKKSIIIRSEKTLSELKAEQERHGFINLDKLDDKETGETETSREVTNSEDHEQKVPLKGDPSFDLLRRFGKYWCKVTERNEAGRPIKVEPGINKDGEKLEGAELHEVIISFAVSESSKTMIGFNLMPYIDADGYPFRPIIKGLCYIHPTRDTGMGDGQLNREIQIGIDDTFNMGLDRVRLATMPTFKGRKYSIEDNSDVYMEPNHVIPLENPEDLVELKIDDNITGALSTISMLVGSMDKTMSIYPGTMGQQGAASKTATSSAVEESRTDTRANYKAMTFDYTALAELYWMIQQMTYRFADESTGMRLMGDKMYDFDPTKNYYYKPVTASIESEQSKDAKINRTINAIGYATNIQHPDAVKIVNKLYGKLFTLMGDEFADFAESLLDEETPIASGSPSQAGGAMPTSNQYGSPQSLIEQGVR